MNVSIGTIISTTRNGREVRGRIVGIEPSRHRYGYQRNGYVAVVLPHRDREPVEVYIPQDASGVTVCDVGASTP